MGAQDVIDVERALHMLDNAILLLQATAAVSLAAVLYGVWRWHRSKWR